MRDQLEGPPPPTVACFPYSAILIDPSPNSVSSPKTFAYSLPNSRLLLSSSIPPNLSTMIKKKKKKRPRTTGRPRSLCSDEASGRQAVQCGPSLFISPDPDKNGKAELGLFWSLRPDDLFEGNRMEEPAPPPEENGLRTD